MIIDLKAVPREGTRRFEFLLDKDWWRPEGQGSQALGLDAPLTVKIEIYRAGDKYVVEGYLEGPLKVGCDRCLKVHSRQIHSDFRVFMALPPPDMEEGEIELLEEDLEVNFIKGEEIDLDEIIQEQLYLSLPIKSLCREDCRGLCPLCGKDLNEGDCACEKPGGHPGFSVLKGIKIIGE